MTPRRAPRGILGQDVSESISEDDKKLLRRFLGGQLAVEKALELNRRLDSEPELAKALDRLARGSATVALRSSEFGTTRLTTVAVGHAVRRAVGSGVELRDVLARGGMGTVHEGEQRSLGRSVAVKTATPAFVGPLLEEARVTGYLEHPNIVPIHEIAHDETGTPIVVLKRIEGVSWRARLEDDHPVEGSPDSMIERHVNIAIQVCHALRYAHSRNIVHRDVKPANVMIGSFDEVYLLDWGLALSLDDDDHERFLTRGKARGASGTPSYMAPEQFEVLADRIGPQTDVYLTAASLFHALTGKPPQPGRELNAIHRSLRRRESLRLPDWMPFELADILNRAMAVEPDERTPTAEVLRNELNSFLAHQGSNQLVRRGDRAADRMSELHRAGDDAEAERAFFDATSSYRAATEAWDENPVAPARLAAAVEAQVSALLGKRSPRAAERALSLLEHPPDELANRVKKALSSDRADRDRLREFDHGEDRVFGLHDRRRLAAVLGAVWVGWWATMAAAGVTTVVPVLVGSAASLVLFLGAFYRYRRVMLEVRLNRYNVGIGMGALAVQTLLAAVAVARGDSFDVFVDRVLGVWVLGTLCAGAVVDRRIAVSGLLMSLLIVACSWWPALTSWSPVLATVVMVAVSLVINILTARAADRRSQTNA